MESIGDCLEVWAVLNPIHFEVWVWRGVSQMLHVQTTVWKISDQVWLCHDGLRRWGLAQRATPQIWSRDLINSKSFYYCKTSFQNFEVVFKRWSDSEPRRLCWERCYAHDDWNQVCACDLFFERVASSVSTGELWPCAHNMATSITPRTCNARDVWEYH